MSLNRHIRNDIEPICFFCGKPLRKDEHGLHFQGTKADGSGYQDIYMHWVCHMDFTMLMFKDMRFSEYQEKMKLTTIPRTMDTQHLKVHNWTPK